ncbi:amidohydrolase [Cellulomonas chengniuliangii]|uniref:Amidohydrolase family protein n=1 Tax=Cellulomonas chengniuliangii TaxID=2968084 RepID=A0ABY5L2J4_9CELL|nr:amidohydrolase family protein [Cellulomonas chengniuliangii]MCC2307673.1 amidohydrolase family protein [Cellulomonas chengniuliangii]UUI76864.1 amidohydrolase family protein [Cellulomonas chengniuliangii]
MAASPVPVLLARARPLDTTGDPGLVDVLLREGRVAAIGPAGSLDASLSSGTRVERVDLDGRTLMPGLWDAHTHLTQWALARDRLDVSAATSAAHAVRLVVGRLADRPPRPGTALVGYGFRDGLWPDVPTAALLDAAAGATPVVLVSGDLHCGWLSTAGLAYLGVGEHPTGVLREDEWLPVMGEVDRVPDEVADALVAEAVKDAATLGVVGVVDLEIADNVDVWRRRAATAAPAARIRAGVWEAHLDRVLREGLVAGDPLTPDGLVTQGPFKVITDGSLNTRTAFCHDPYPGASGSQAHGILAAPPERLVPLLEQVTRHGLRVAVHAIGDAANTLALDAFAATGARGAIEHAQLLTPADVLRFAELDIVASVQPEHAMDDRDVADRHWAGRTGRAFPFAALHRAGVRLALGSDAPVAPLDPWTAIDAAVVRARDAREPWHPEQSIDLDVALAASVDEQALGLAVGAPADLAVLDEDPHARLLRAGHVRGLPVAGTLVAGGWAHRDL